MTLHLFQARVIAERDELAVKVEKLHAFTGTETMRALDQAERVRLMRQFAAMKDYEQVLNERIAAFTE